VSGSSVRVQRQTFDATLTSSSKIGTLITCSPTTARPQDVVCRHYLATTPAPQADLTTLPKPPSPGENSATTRNLHFVVRLGEGKRGGGRLYVHECTACNGGELEPCRPRKARLCCYWLRFAQTAFVFAGKGRQRLSPRHRSSLGSPAFRGPPANSGRIHAPAHAGFA